MAMTSSQYTPYKAKFISPNQARTQAWIIDTGATAHISFNKENISNFMQTVLFETVVRDDSLVTTHGFRDVRLVALVVNKKIFHNIWRDLYVPDLKHNFLLLCPTGGPSFDTIFQDKVCKIKKGIDIISKGTVNSRLNTVTLSRPRHLNGKEQALLADMRLRHLTLAHIPADRICEMCWNAMVQVINVSLEQRSSDCPGCMYR